MVEIGGDNSEKSEEGIPTIYCRSSIYIYMYDSNLKYIKNISKYPASPKSWFNEAI